jgi:Rod binding domain-containing protein
MKISQVPPQELPSNQRLDARALRDRAPKEMVDAADGMEAHFHEMMMKSMRDTVEESEFSLHNSATNIYQGMLDDEYAQKSARVSPLGLSDQILEYLLRSQPNAQYNNNQGSESQNSAQNSVIASNNGNHEPAVKNGRTGGTK